VEGNYILKLFPSHTPWPLAGAKAKVCEAMLRILSVTPYPLAFGRGKGGVTQSFALRAKPFNQNKNLLTIYIV
jgi:hypothetical protein